MSARAGATRVRLGRTGRTLHNRLGEENYGKGECRKDKDGEDREDRDHTHTHTHTKSPLHLLFSPVLTPGVSPDACSAPRFLEGTREENKKSEK